VTADESWVSVETTADTAAFAVQSIRTWLDRMGRGRYPHAHELTITADCGGSKGARVRLWKLELQKLADKSGLVIDVHRYPPGMSRASARNMSFPASQPWRRRMDRPNVHKGGAGPGEVDKENADGIISEVCILCGP
jgi:hypothetical protein